MKKIKLTTGEKCLVDDIDFDRLNKHRWYGNKDHGSVSRIYVYSTTFINWNNKSRRLKLHRFILDIDNPKILVDHINGDTLDNRRENLRICNNRENSNNSKAKGGMYSKYKGVTWHKKNKKWQVVINHEYVGQFNSELEAAKAYDIKATQLHKEFAKLNFPKED